MNEIVIYTDGTRKNEFAAWSSIILYNGIEIEKFSGLEERKTINRMELQAVVNSLEKLLCGKLKSKISGNNLKIIIRSDSAYVVNTYNRESLLVDWQMNGWKTNSGEPIKNGDLWESLYELVSVLKLSGIEIVFEKIRAHSGNAYNNLADRLAKEEVNKIIKKRGKIK